jgi:hypothetical protein
LNTLNQYLEKSRSRRNKLAEPVPGSFKHRVIFWDISISVYELQGFGGSKIRLVLKQPLRGRRILDFGYFRDILVYKIVFLPQIPENGPLP